MVENRQTVDVIMLACSKTKELQLMTQAAIDSLHASSKLIQFNVILLESHAPTTHMGGPVHPAPTPWQLARATTIPPPAPVGPSMATPWQLIKTSPPTSTPPPPPAPIPVVSYAGAATYYPDPPFHYNRYMNYGLRLCRNEIIVMANNDLEFHEGWMDTMLRHDWDSASPRCPVWPLHKEYLGKVACGYAVGRELAGWCIVTKRSTMDRIGGQLDEQFDFYSQDVDYANCLRAAGLKHFIIGTAHVTHLLSQSSKDIDGLAKLAAAQKLLDHKWANTCISTGLTPTVASHIPQPKITVIIPTTNQTTLSRSIMSLLAQGQPSWAARVGFDGVAAADRPSLVQDKRVSYSFYPPVADRGPMHGAVIRNALIKESHTDWLCFLDDDDTFRPDYMTRFYAEVAAHADADVIMFRMSFSAGDTYVLPPLEISKPTLYKVGISFAIRRAFMLQHNLSFKNKQAEDYTLLDEAVTAGAHIYFSNHICYNIRYGF